MLLCMLLMYTTSHSKIRQQSYETFWYTHHLFVPFLLAMYTHATGCFVRAGPEPVSPFAGQRFWDVCIGYEGWRWELVAFALYVGERVWREVQSRRSTEITKVIKHPYGNIPPTFLPHTPTKLTDQPPQTPSKSNSTSPPSTTKQANTSTSTSPPSPSTNGTPSQ